MPMIRENVRRILKEIPEEVILLAATKGRRVDEIMEAIDAGVRVIGENYVQEAARKYNEIGKRVEWHFIGHLQRNKVKKACEIFDVIETIHNEKIAKEIDKRCHAMDKIMPVMIEINSGREENKSGVYPENALSLAEFVYSLENVRLVGVMTMGPLVDEPEKIRPYFRLTREIFERMREEFGDEIKYLSMGMSDTYRIAIEEGANIIRVGTAIFGPRQKQ